MKIVAMVLLLAGCAAQSASPPKPQCLIYMETSWAYGCMDEGKRGQIFLETGMTKRDR